MMVRVIVMPALHRLTWAASPALRAAPPVLRDNNATGMARSIPSASLLKAVGDGRVIKAVLHLPPAAVSPRLTALWAIRLLRRVALGPVLPTALPPTTPTVLLATPLHPPHQAAPVRRETVNTWFPMNGAMVSPAPSASPTRAPVRLMDGVLIGATATARPSPMRGTPISPAAIPTLPAILAGTAAFSRANRWSSVFREQQMAAQPVALR